MSDAITAGVLARLLRASLSRPAIRNQQGDVELRTARPMRIFVGIAIALFGSAALGVPAAAWLQDDAELWRLTRVATPFCGILAVGALCELRVRLFANDLGIGGRTAFRGHRQVRWKDVTEVTWSNRSTLFRLVDRNGEVVRVSCWLQGFPEFLQLLRTQVGRTVYEQALAACIRQMQLYGVALPEEEEEEIDERPAAPTPHR